MAKRPEKTEGPQQVTYTAQGWDYIVHNGLPQMDGFRNHIHAKAHHAMDDWDGLDSPEKPLTETLEFEDAKIVRDTAQYVGVNEVDPEEAG